jgi:NAD(P)-dependent dehydrogenase (short-subunit alcohol dehydrogenase family)
MMDLLRDKVAIVTGASSGIGRGIADVFVDEGAKLVLAARNQMKLDQARDELQSKGRGSAIAVPTDVRNEKEVIALFERTKSEFGRLDILVNNAGTGVTAPIEETTLEMWHRTLDTNLTGPFLCTREALKIMKPQRGGRIINIGSISAQVPRPNSVAYACSKRGLAALTRATALEGRSYGVVASCLHPGNVATEMDPNPGEPVMAVKDFVNAVLTMATLPSHVNMLETIVLPVTQAYLGRG